MINHNNFFKRHLIISLFLLLMLAGCEKNYVQPPSLPTTPASFKVDIIPIFEANCISCHKAGSGLPAFTADIAYDQLLTDGPNAPYVDVANPESSILYKKLNKNMPPAGKLSNDKIALVLQWITEGAKNN